MKALDRTCSGEVLGDEDVTVPAGRFSTRKLKVKCALPATHFSASAFLGFNSQLELTVWVDPVRYRPIKIHKSLVQARDREMDELRLVRVTRAADAVAQ
jgi:hypothetical protein